MEFRQLETFVEVVNLKSFSKAAEKLFITQPTVTNHIQNLEKELDTILLNRLGKQISLTDPGKLLYKYAVNILNSCEMAKFDLASFKGKIQGHLHIYSSSIPRKYILPKIIKGFLEIYPDVEFTIGDKDSKKVIKDILNGETDFGILGAKYPSNNIEYIDLLQDKLVLVTPNREEYPENFSTISRDIVFKEKLIFREEGSGTRAIVENILKNAGISMDKLNVIGYVEDIETTKELISLGVGVSFISKKAIMDDLDKERFKAFYLEELDFQRKFYFAYHKNRQLSPLSDTFMKYILKYVEDQEI